MLLYHVNKLSQFCLSILDNGQQSPSPGSSDALIRSFPIAKLQKLDELISNPRWVIPVLPKGKSTLI